jgi:AcrR family transcriptional regulator
MSALQRREQLLDVTAEMVAERGFGAASIQSVARAAGISRPIVYEHFGDLPGLLKALVAREMEQALEQVSRSALAELPEGDPAERLLESLRTYLVAVVEHPHTWRLVLMPPEGAPEMLRRSIRLGRAGVLDRLTEAVAPGVSPGRESPDPEVTARTLSAIADEYARLVLTDPAAFPIDRLLTHARWFVSQLSAAPAPAPAPAGSAASPAADR